MILLVHKEDTDMKALTLILALMLPVVFNMNTDMINIGIAVSVWIIEVIKYVRH